MKAIPNIFFCLACLLLMPYASTGQEKVDWDLLAKVKYDYSYNETFNQWIGTPTFDPELEKLNGKEIEISGYILPMDVEGDYYVLSAYPYVSCFFCGGAGMESVMELQLKNNQGKFGMDEHRTFKGTFRLNAQDFELTYTLEEAEAIGR